MPRWAAQGAENLMASDTLPFEAYRGDGDYIFASYAHADSSEVYRELIRLNGEGFNLWYDEGITPSTRWSEELAGAIDRSAVFLAFITPNFIASENCVNEIEFAFSRGIPVVAVHLEETTLPPGLQLNLGNKQAILRGKYRPEVYERKLGDHLSRILGGSGPTRGSEAQSTHDGRSAWGWIAEMRRRHVFRTAGIYIVAAWVFLQVCDLAFDSFDLPTQAIRYVWFALIALFPLALFWGWRYDITASGIVRTLPASADKPRNLKLRAPDFVILATLAAVGLSVLTATVSRIVDTSQNYYPVERPKHDVISAIAILPFENLSADASQVYLAAGLHDALIATLAKIKAFKVISRTSVQRLPKTLTIPEIGERLGVDKLIEGTVTREEDDVRVNIKLIDAEREEYIWSETYLRSFDSLVTLEGEIATEVASAVHVQLTPDEQRHLESRGGVNPETYDTYLRAMYRIRRETGEGMREAMDLLMDAVEDDPTSAMAWAGLAYGYGELGHSAFPEEGAYVRSKAAADRAIDLDPNLAEAHLAVGMYQLYYEWDFAAAEATFQRAVEINPSLVEAHYHLAWLYELVGRDEEAIRAGELTKEIDPLSPFYSGWLAEQYRDAGMYDTAIEEAEATLQLRPDFPVAYYSLGQTYKDLGNFEKAIANHEKLQDNYYWAYALAATLGAAGRIEEALEISRKYEEDGNLLPLVLIYAAMGDNEAAFKWLLQCRDAKIPWYPWLLTWWPETRTFRNDPRVVALTAELGL